MAHNSPHVYKFFLLPISNRNFSITNYVGTVHQWSTRTPSQTWFVMVKFPLLNGAIVAVMKVLKLSSECVASYGPKPAED